MREYFEKQTRKVYTPAYKPNHMVSMTRPYDVVNQGQPPTTGLNKEELNDAFQSLIDKHGRLPNKGRRPPRKGGLLPDRGGRLPDKRPPHALHHANADGDGLIGEEEPPLALHHADADIYGFTKEEVVRTLLRYA